MVFGVDKLSSSGESVMPISEEGLSACATCLIGCRMRLRMG